MTSPPHEVTPDRAWRAGVMGAIGVLVAVVSARLLVAISIIGAAFLTWVVLQNPDQYKLIALGIYMLAPVSTVWLASR